MSTRSTSSSSTVLIVIILVLTFPLWIGLGGALIGVVAGLFGAMIGVMAALFGGIIALIAFPFKLLFGWGHWSGHWPHVFHGNAFVWLALLIFAALVINKRRK